MIDNISSTLFDVTSAIDYTTMAFQEVHQAASSGIDITPIESVTDSINEAAMAAQRLENGLDNISVSNVNMAYNNLNSTVDAIDQNIRENQSAQNQFNESVQRGQVAADGLLNKITRIASAYLTMQAGLSVINLSDTVAQTEARLNLIVDDGGSVEELQNKIFAMAQRTGAEYLEVSQTISKLGLLAGKSFSSNDEIIMFTELMNKNFAIGGASIQEQTAAMYQLTQSMAAGKLQGDEFRSIIENAPLLANAIEDYMLSIGEAGTLKDWSADGLLTAEVVKNALFSSADEINERYNALGETFSRTMIRIKNDAIMAFDPVLDRLNEIANSTEFQTLATNISATFTVLADATLWLFDSIGAAAGFISSNWSVIAPIILGAAAALAVYAITVNIATIAERISAITTGIATVAKWAYVAVMSVFSITAARAAAAQLGLNAAMSMNPIGLVVMGITILIAILYTVIAEINRVANTSISATGIIVGAFFWLASVIANIFFGILEIAFGIINAMVNPFIEFANFIGNLFVDPVSAVVYLFQGMADNVLEMIEKVASALDFVFGSNMAADVSGWRSGLKQMADDFVKERGFEPNDFNQFKELDLSVKETLGLDRFDNTEAFDKGYGIGEMVDDYIGNLFTSKPLSKGGGGLEKYTPTIAEYPPPLPEPGGGLSIPDSVAENIENIDKHTKDSLTLSEEDLKYLRDIAERDAVNKFTTAEVSVSFLGGINNNINNEMDLDGIVDYIGEKVAETLEAVAEGVHQ